MEKQIIEWQAVTFPQSAPQGVYTHLTREFIEFIYAYTEEPEKNISYIKKELADIFILSVSLANHLGFSMTDAIANKMTVNKLRKWGKPDADGVIEHVRDGD